MPVIDTRIALPAKETITGGTQSSDTKFSPYAVTCIPDDDSYKPWINSWGPATGLGASAAKSDVT
jgi:hypothetical protein